MRVGRAVQAYRTLHRRRRSVRIPRGTATLPRAENERSRQTLGRQGERIPLRCSKANPFWSTRLFATCAQSGPFAVI